MNEEKSLLKAIRQRKHRWLGCVLRHDSLLRDVLEGRMMGKPTRGWKRLHLLSDMCCDKSYQELKRGAQDTFGWKIELQKIACQEPAI